MKTKEEILHDLNDMMRIVDMIQESGFNGTAGAALAIHAIQHNARGMLLTAERIGIVNAADLDALIDQYDL